MVKISILIAFTGGVLSFLSPCVLPLIPSYLCLITGLTLKDLLEGENCSPIRKTMVINSLLFILGFSLILVILGSTASLVGKLLFAYRDLLRIFGGGFIIIMGLYFLGLFKLRILNLEKRFHLKIKPPGYFGSFLIGITFAAAWTPCGGPILSSILTLASVSETVSSGSILLIFYALGLGIPFFLSSLALDSFFIYFKKIEKYFRIITFFNGTFLIFVGVLILTNYFQSLVTFLLDFYEFF